MCNLKNITCLLFMLLIGLIIGGYWGWMLGMNNINDKLVISAYNEGIVSGSTSTLYVLFHEYIKKNPYNIDYEEEQ